MPAVDKETEFAELVRKYENLWIALNEKDGVKAIVGSGTDAVEAADAAESNGFPDAVLFRVPSFTSSFIPTVSPHATPH